MSIAIQRARAGGPPSSKGRAHWGSVLVIDDEPSTLEAMKEMLSPHCRVTTGKTGHDALRLAEIASPDVVLLDLGLPDMNGIEVCRLLKARESLIDVPVVVVTQFDDGDSQKRAFEVGATDFISKPLRASVILTRVRNLMESRKRLLHTLQLSEARWRFALEGSEFGMWDWDTHRGQMTLSPALCKVLGLPTTDHVVSYEDWLEWVHPGDRVRVETHLHALKEGTSSAQSVEYRVSTVDGGLVWLQERARVLHRSEGVPERIMALLADTTERRVSERRIRKLSRYDPVTELPNRKACLDLLSEEIPQVAGAGKRGFLLRVNLSGLARTNTSLGRSAGDELLRQAAERMRVLISSRGQVCQFGGKEFAILASFSSERTPDGEADLLVADLRDELARPFCIDGEQILCQARVGVASILVGTKPEGLIRRAEVALTEAKQLPGGVCFFAQEMLERYDERSRLLTDLEQGLFTDQFHLAFQPIVSTNGELIGVEGLARWRHPERGLVRPDVFIPLAEEAGLIIPLGARLRRQACDLLASWATDDATKHLKVSVNVSPAEFMATGFARDLLHLVAQSSFDPARLELELTESLLLSSFEGIAESMNRVREAGLSFALDDFGTGYSSLSYLKRLPFTRLKVDRSFVRDILTSETDQALARTIITMAQSLGLEVVAEGVEDESQVRLLSEMGCRMFQGYLFGRPDTAEAIYHRAKEELSSTAATTRLPDILPLSKEKSGIEEASILVVDDDESTLEIFRHILDGYHDVRTTKDPHEGMRLAESSPPDLLILDRNMGEMGGLDLSRQLRRLPALADVPVIFITSETHPSAELEAFEVGAADFVTKPVSAARILVTVRNQLERKRQTDSLRRQASLDPLTGLANRRSFSRALSREASRSAEIGSPISLIMLDVDHFKSINDTHGHPVGDMCLERVAAVLREKVHRPTDLVARYGGEEFVVLMPHADEAVAERGAHVLVRAIEEASIRASGDSGAPLTVSAGWATGRPGDDARELSKALVDAADRALLRAKEKGRNRVCGPDDLTSVLPMRASS